MIPLTNEEIFRMFRESPEADFQLFLEKYIEFLIELDKGDENGYTV